MQVETQIASALHWQSGQVNVLCYCHSESCINNADKYLCYTVSRGDLSCLLNQTSAWTNCGLMLHCCARAKAVPAFS